MQGGQVVKYTAMLACGNYNGVIGFAKAKGPAIPIALQKVSPYMLHLIISAVPKLVWHWVVFLCYIERW